MNRNITVVILMCVGLLVGRCQVQDECLTTNRTIDLTGILNWHVYTTNGVIVVDTNGVLISEMGWGITNYMQAGMTNMCVAMTNTIPWAHRIVKIARYDNEITNLVDVLCREGDVCRVKGHAWRWGRPGESDGSDGGIAMSFLDYHPGTTYRTCKICGKCESKTEGDWK